MSETTTQPVTSSVPVTPSAVLMPAPGQTFSAEYVKELREENKGWRLKASEMEGLAKTKTEALEKTAREAKEAAEAAVKQAAEYAEAKIAEARSTADQRIIRSEIRAAAIKAGMIDLDGLKMIDTTSVKLDDNGEPIGAAELMEATKKAKPYLFGDAKTSNTSTAPDPSPAKPKHVSDMTPEEKRAAYARIANGQPPV